MNRGTFGPPSTLAGRYQLLEMIGVGGMATVWRGFDGRLERTVAVKVISEHLAGEAAFRNRFEREARHVAGLAHPNVVAVHDYGIDADRAFIVMEYVAGPSLRELLAERTALSIEEVGRLAADVLAAVGHAHAHEIVHRDIKPGNILITEGGTAKVADFGVAKAAGQTTEVTLPGSVVGTAIYASPEQLVGASAVPASDLYSLGCVLYECLTGQPPFDDEDVGRLVLRQRYADPVPVGAVRPDVPPSMAAAVMRALSKDPDDRFDSAASMADALRPGPVPGRADPPTALGPPKVSRTPVTTAAQPAVARLRRRRSWRRPLLVGLVLAGLIGAAIGVAVSLGGGPGPGSHPSGAGSAGVLAPGDVLGPGRTAYSPNGRFGLTMRPDGALVTFDAADELVTWMSGDGGPPGAYAVLQSDGDLVVYPEGHAAPAPGQPTTALWSSGTSGHPGASLVIDDNGDLQIRARDGGPIVWQTGAAPGGRGSELLSGGLLHPGQFLASPNGRYRFLDDSTGALRLYRPGQPSCTWWTSPGRGVVGSYAEVSPDGQLVLYGPGGSTVEWRAGSTDNLGASLVIDDNGALVLSSAGGVVLWETPAAPDCR